MKKLEFIKKSGFIFGIIVLLMAVMPMSDGLVVQAQPPMEYGDAPDPTYPSLLVNNGARHVYTETEILGLGLSMGDLKDPEPDALIPDMDMFDDGLNTFFIGAGNPAATVTFEVTNWMGSDLFVNILIDLDGDGDWNDFVGPQSEHVVQNQLIFLPAVNEGTFVSLPFSTMGATPGPTWLRLTLTRVPIGAPWDGIVQVPFEYGETEDHEIFIEPAPDLPDLEVVEKYETVEGCEYWVTYVVFNSGNGPAGASTTCIYADGVPVTTAPCPALLVGEWDENTVGPFSCPGGTEVWIVVEADNDNDVVEEDEGNNYYENLMEQPLEFGDAADPTYPSLLASDGSRHCPTDTELLGLGWNGQDCKDFELDALVIDNDACCDGLVTTFITTNDPAATVTFEVTNFITMDPLIVNILIDLNIDGDWTDAGEHVVQNQLIFLPGPAEATFVSTPFSTVGATPGPTWLRLTLSRTPVTVPWDGTGLFPCGETEDWNITMEGGFYWKPGNWTDYAPSGMPDFDQKQDNWTDTGTPAGNWTYCGPVAVANSLWWFDSREETGGIPPPAISDSYSLVTTYGPWDDHNVTNVQPLVNDLAWYMDTDGQRTGIPHNGTDVMDMQKGIRDYLNATGYNDSYYEHTEPWPDFYWIEEEVERCQDVILLLGFYHNYDGYYEHIGGHYVTCAGVNSAGLQIGISDPFFDNAGAGGPGRVPVPHAYPHNASVHNDTQYVSHDTYNVTQIFPLNMPPPPPGCWALQNYPVGTGPPGINITGFIGQNGGPGWYNPGWPVEVIIEYAVAVSPIVVDATLVGHINFSGAVQGPKWVRGLDVTFFDNATQNETAWSPMTATTNGSGWFTVSGLDPGTYDIGIKNCTSLSEMVLGIVLTGGGTTYADFGTSREGDCNEDDMVTAMDRGLLYNGWNTFNIIQGGYLCDLNRDGMLTSMDRGLMYDNWNTGGDELLY